MQSYLLTRWIYTRLIALVYFFAFVSAATQIVGLLGKHGLSPAAPYLDAMMQYIGPTFYWSYPTVFWFANSDAALVTVCWLGAVLALIACAGFASQIILAILFYLYLSIVNVGGNFFSYQWDALLLEVGFVSIFFCDAAFIEPPWKVPEPFHQQSKPSPVALWLLRLILFKLMLLSGLVKWQSEDVTWRNFSALDYHYWTQPLPTPIGWWVGHLPHWFQQCSVAFMFLIELVVPFLIFFHKKLRAIAAALLVILQVNIALTGNYTFFNLLTVTLCITLVEDSTWIWLFEKIKTSTLRLGLLDRITARPLVDRGATKKTVEYAVASLICLLTACHFSPFIRNLPVVNVLQSVASTLDIVNAYGLFAVMTTTRHEIIVEGSDDAENWKAYEFKFKPGDLKRSPPVVAPMQPRLDWQMWFAALGPVRESTWMKALILRLLQGEPTVLALLDKNPFPAHPPQYIRSTLYDYHFSTIKELESAGNWWTREYIGEFTPPVRLPHEGSPKQ